VDGAVCRHNGISDWRAAVFDFFYYVYI